MSKLKHTHKTQAVHRFMTSGIPNSVLVSKYLCAQCWGVLVELWVEEETTYKVKCPKNCQPGGFVTKHGVEIAQDRDKKDYLEVAQNYPDLAGIKKTTKDDSLFGKEEF